MFTPAGGPAQIFVQKVLISGMVTDRAKRMKIWDQFVKFLCMRILYISLNSKRNQEGIQECQRRVLCVETQREDGQRSGGEN